MKRSNPGLAFPVSLVAMSIVATTAAGQDSARSDQELGKRFEVKAGSLPEPYAEPGVRNPALVTDRGQSSPKAPHGFEVQLFAENLTHPRQMLVLDNGDVLLAEQEAGFVTLLRDDDDDGEADFIEHFAQGFEQPYGLAARPGEILVADVEGVWRVPLGEGQVRASGSEIYGTAAIGSVTEALRRPQMPMDHFAVTDQGVFGDAIGHTTRSLAIHPDDGRLFVGVGSAGNIGEEPLPRASIQVFASEGGNQQTYASGMRNPIGIGFHPETKALWTIVQERDGLGNRLAPDYFTKVEEGGFYGWPYAYAGGKPQPQFADRAPEKVEATLLPDLLFEAHSAAMDFVFYEGDQFPAEYRGDAFVALKGSWNRADPTGYKIVRVKFGENGEPEGWYENFLTGFWIEGDERAVVWGRPADIAMLPDGSLLVADDTGGTIWRVSYAETEREASSAAPRT